MDNNSLIKRNIFPLILDHLSDKEITVIIGPRQVGKTTLLDQIRIFLIQKQKKDPKLLPYFNLDLTKDLSLFSRQENVINFIKDRRSRSEKMYLFIDEVQRIANAGKFLKGIYDLKLGIKIIATGSSSLEIKSKIQEPLTGRKKIFQLMPLNFSEYANFKNPVIYKIAKNKERISEYDSTEWKKLINDFAVYGGYPRVVIEKNVNKKVDILEELHNSYLEKDIVNFLKINKIISFNKLVSLLAAQAGGLLNINQLAKDTAVEAKTLNYYLTVLENTFIIKLIRPFFTNSKKELIKMPKVYFFDSGLRNFSLARFGNLDERVDKGETFENLVASELLKIIKPPHSLAFWRSLQKAEVDFIIRKGNGKIIPIEVKAQSMDKINISRGYQSFLKKYKPAQAFIVNYDRQAEKQSGGARLSLITLSNIEKILIN
ncbi:ATPase [Candidatus Falkowbacteria bacterium CG11_big_fil_rev_8_21_14_0_20_39_10]|uniref:ATPase n=1 Tax=Candidatus Falkowbacteria bacterium CG11_big_fil_rev_8_21_14_0_20_39_10 TaxID=1974570 RepID=A0A2M6K871_9BACT|nr:MAG: ATPase [Candidatus Falkowbacteria bacterium CG11_big_fil_rev_8_21_14_0_20_39_10]